MAWTVEVGERARKELARIDRAEARRITRYLRERVVAGDNPRQLGKPLKGGLSGLWRYRVGDYRIVCEIRDAVMVVLVIRVASRKDVYRI